jgi:ribosomal protein L34E
MTYLLWLLVVGGVGLAAFVFTRRYLAARGARLVECPENQQTAAVKVASAWAALGGDWRLADCSRWPEQRSCGREALAQIEESPEDCLVRSFVTKWYEDKSCAVCGKPLGAIDWHERKPAVMDQQGRARPWPEVKPEALPQVLATHRPVCFDCYVAETFRREHPELVIDNPWVKQ